MTERPVHVIEVSFYSSAPTEIEMTARGPYWHMWKFVHNALIHPLLAFPWEPLWVQRIHDWTAKRCWGGG